MAITPLPSPPSRAEPDSFSSKADAFLGQLPTFASEANSLAADVNSKQSAASSAASTATLKAAEAVTSANNASTSASNASTSANNASTSSTTAQNWAIKTDGPVSGGEYSAKYWGQIAQGFVVGTLFDDGAVSSAKTWTSSKISTWAAKLANGNTFTGSQNFFNYAGGFPAQASSYSIKVPGGYGGGYLLEDGSNYISLYSTGGTLSLGFGSTATSIASKYSFNAAGDFTATGRVTSAGITSSNTGTFVDQVVVSGISSPLVTVAKSGQNTAYLHSSDTGWGLYSDSGGNILIHNRADGKNYFSGIAADDIWRFSAGTVSLGTSGYTRLPNGLIIQWGKTSLATGNRPITFPYTFPNGVLTCNATKSSTGSWGPSTGIAFNKITNSGAEIGCSESSNDVYWSVIGY